MRVAIIGAGPAGLTCATRLVDEMGGDVSVDVYEVDSVVGGMTKSFGLWGQRVDLGPHRFFSKDERVNRFWLEQVGDDFIMVDRLTRIYYDKKFFLYPVKAMNALANLGFFKAVVCVLSYCRAQFSRNRGKERTFEEWVSNKFGRKLYTIFFKTYSERQWGIPCSELDADFARQRIKGLNMLEVIKNALFHSDGNKHKTLVEQFAYPKMGGGTPYEYMAEKLRQCGANIYLSTPVNGIAVENGKAVGVVSNDGSVIPYDYVVSTAPFTEMLCSIPESEIRGGIHALARSLVYRNTTLVYLEVEKTDIFKDNWIYVHDTNVTFGRLTNFRNWSPYMQNGKDTTILCLEYWSYDDELWNMSDDGLIALAKKEIVRTELVAADALKDGYVVKMHRSYPVYNTGYQTKMDVLQKAADKIDNLAFIGSNGSFNYNNQDHSILMGLLAADNIIAGDTHNDLWSMNTDYDYQESGRSLDEKKEIVS